MNTPLALAFLFFVGAMLGWIIEFLFRNLISHSGPRDYFFINPGFCKGPYLPIYGVGLCTMFVISYMTTMNHPDSSPILIILEIGVCMTFIELVGGLFLLNVMHLRLWDYRNEFLNYKGVICPLFSLIWASLGALYYLFIHPLCIDGIIWLSNNLAFSFFVGLFFGVFIVDIVLSTRDIMGIKKLADEHEIIVKLEELKELLLKKRKEAELNFTFFNQLKVEKKNIRELFLEIEKLSEDRIVEFKNKKNKTNA